MPNETQIKEARERIGNLYGIELARKASDEFCLTFGIDVGAGNIGFAESAPVVRTQATVLEFSRESPTRREIDRSIENVRRNDLWSRLLQDARELSAIEDSISLQASQLLRNVKLHAVRDDFYRSAGPVCNEVERGARGFFQPGPETLASPQTPSAVTEICWLNRTVRVFVDPRLIAEVASDRRIEQIDLPRRLEAEIVASTRTVGAPQYRDRFNVTGKGVVVGVIDSEVALQHPALSGRVIHKQNYTKEPWGNPGAHGTAIAGIIGASDQIFQGVAPDVTIYNYKVLATNKFLNADDFGGSLAIQQALEDGAHVVNCSWGAGPAGNGTSREARACDEAWALGMTIVKSAGNQGSSPQTLTTPADAEGVIVVGATDREGQAVQDYSSRGFTPDGKKRPHLVAPGGVDIEGITSCQVGGGFGDCGHGTSYAAPHISGLLALVLQRQPELSPDEQRDLLLDCCRAFDPNDLATHGRGLLSLEKLVTD